MNLLVTTTAALVFVTALPYLAFLTLYAWLRPDGSPVEKRPAEPTVSIVLPTYNESSIIETKLDDLMNLDYPEELIEVVVVDSSDDETPELIEEYFADREEPKLTLIEERERTGVANAVNRAVQVASGTVIFRTDCDSKLAEDALQEAVANLADDDVSAVTGRQAEVLGGSAVESDYRDLLTRVQAVESYLDSTLIAHGPCFAFERDAFLPLPPNTVADDTEIAIGVRRQGKRVVMDPTIHFAESGVSAFSARRKRKDRRALGLVQSLVRNRDMLWGYGRYGRVILPFNWIFLLITPWLSVLTVLVGVSAAVSVVGVAGLALPAIAVAGFWLGQRELLGPFQLVHAFADAQVSLLIGSVEFVLGRATGTWEIDRSSREVFE